MGGVRFSFTIEGQPPSWNKSYRIVKIPTRNGIRATLAKTAEAEAYQLIAKSACHRAIPKGWTPFDDYQPKMGVGLIPIRIVLKLGRDMDADNALKLLLDAIKWALEIDDNRFLPQVIEKSTGWKHPSVEVRIG